MDKKWKSYLENKEAEIEGMQEKIDIARKIYENIKNTNSLSNRELSLLLEPQDNSFSYYTLSNIAILKKDKVYNKLEDLKEFIVKYTIDFEYLLIFKQIDWLKEKIAQRTMEKRQYDFISANSLERLAEEILGRKLPIKQVS